MDRFHPGQKVVYRAPHVRPDEPGEEGVVVSVSDRFVFVRYGVDVHPKATSRALLEPISPPPAEPGAA